MSTRTEYPNFVGNTGKFLKVNATETDVLWDEVDASDITGVLGIDHGGTGADNANDALNNLLPDQTGHAGEALFTDGTDSYWSAAGAGGGVDTRVYTISALVMQTSSRTVYAGLLGSANNQTVEASILSPFYENVIVKSIHFFVNSNSCNEDATVVIRKNGVDTTSSVVIPSGTTGNFTISSNESFSSSDNFSIRATISGTATGFVTIGGASAPGNPGMNIIVQVSGGTPLGVQSVSGNGVNNTDPFNPIVRTANTTTEGTLTAADWNTFNNKQNAITTGNLSSPTSGVTVGTGTGRLVGGNSTISIATATGSQQGLLSSADWNTFNNKQNALPTLCVVKAYKNLLGGAASPFIADTEVFDTTSSYDNTTGIFTAPRTGYYLITASFSVEGHSADPSSAAVQVIKNGSAGIDQDSIRFNGTEGASDYWKRRLKVSTTTSLSAGETIEFNVSINTGTMSVTGGVEGNQITISELR